MAIQRQLLIKDTNIMFGINTNPLIYTNRDAIENMLAHVLAIDAFEAGRDGAFRGGERVFEPTFGCSLPRLLFQPCTQRTADSLLASILIAVRKWLSGLIDLDPRTTFVNANPSQEEFIVSMQYKVLASAEVIRASISLPVQGSSNLTNAQRNK